MYTLKNDKSPSRFFDLDALLEELKSMELEQQSVFAEH